MSRREECIGKPVAEVIWLDDTNGEEAAAPQSATTLSIENVAQMFDVSPWTLRYYELRGVIARRQRFGQTRVYSWADCDRIAFIIKCRRAGIGLADIAPILRAVDDDAPAQSIRINQQRCDTLIASLEKPRKVFDEALSELTQIRSLLCAKGDNSD
jgi:DNA-binding transcriptional MerR regulator